MLKKIKPKIAIPAHGEILNGKELEERLSQYEERIAARDRKIKELVNRGEDPVGKGDNIQAVSRTETYV